MINVEMCRGCGRPTYTMAVSNLKVRCDVEGLDAQEAVAALLAAHQLWRVTYVGSAPHRLSPAQPAVLAALSSAEPPLVVTEHRCPGGWKAPGASVTASQGVVGPGGQVVPPKASAGHPGGFSAPVSTAPTAGRRRTDAVCGACTPPAADGVHATIDLADLTAHARHADTCQGHQP